MSKFTSNYAVDLLIRGLDENPDLNKIVYYAISDQYSGAATALSGSLSDVPVVRETIKNAGVVKIDHSIKNELVDTVINVLDPEVKSNNINRRVRSLIDDVLNFAAQKDGSNDILSMFQNVIPVEVTAEHPDTDWDSVLYWILVRSVLVPIVKIPLDKNGKPIIIQDTKKESTSKKPTTFGKRVARMGEEPQKEKKGEPESKETPSEPIVIKPEEKETPEPNFILVDAPKPTPVQAIDTKTGNTVAVEVIDPEPVTLKTKSAAAKTFKASTDLCETVDFDIDTIRKLPLEKFDLIKTKILQAMMNQIEINDEANDVQCTASTVKLSDSLIDKLGILTKYEQCPSYYKDIAHKVALQKMEAILVSPRSNINRLKLNLDSEYKHNLLSDLQDTITTAIIKEETLNCNLLSNILDRLYRSTGSVTEDMVAVFVMDYFRERKLDLSKYKSAITTTIVKTITAA